MNNFEALLRDAARKAEEAMVSDFEANHAEHSFSPAFEAKLHRRPGSRPIMHTLQRVASFALVLLTGCTLWLGTDAEARERFIGWLKAVESRDSVHYYFEGVDDTTPIRYEMTKLPEGYTLIKEDNMGDGSYAQLYKNENGKQFDFGVYQSEDSNIFVEGHGERKTVLVNGIEADYYYHPDRSDRNVLVWVIPETKALIYVHGYQSELELVEIAESVSPVLSIPTNNN